MTNDGGEDQRSLTAVQYLILTRSPCATPDGPPIHNSRRCLGTSRATETALEFLGLFPEALAWNVGILSTDKEQLLIACSRSFLCQSFKNLPNLHSLHFLFDLCSEQTSSWIEGLPSHLWGPVWLQPRAIVETSLGNLQACGYGSVIKYH